MSCSDCWISFLAHLIALLLRFLEAVRGLCCCCWPLTSPQHTLLAQEKVLRHFLRRCAYEVKSSPEYGLNYVVVRRRERDTERQTDNKKESEGGQRRTLVLMHGYAMGLAFFHDNLEALTEHFDEVIAVDWLGMGASERRDTKRVTRLRLSASLSASHNNTHADAHTQDVAEIVSREFTEALDEIRRIEGLSRFVLAGHSMGGYLSAKFALHFPEYVEGLVLISPAGIPELPPHEERAGVQELDWKVRLLMALWRLNITPQSIVRIVGGHRGRALIESYFRRRLLSQQGVRWSEEEVELLIDYLFHVTAGHGNGEFALNALLLPVFLKDNLNVRGREKNSAECAAAEGETQSQPPRRSGVYAHSPLERAIRDELRRDIPVLMLFGDEDWLYFPGAPHTVRAWRESGLRAELVIVPHADHHLQITNAESVNRNVLDWARRCLPNNEA